MQDKKFIFPSIVTTHNADWQKKIDEASALGLEECALFPTCLDYEKRQKFFGALEQSSVRFCPLVHLRHDMTPNEIEYLIKRFKTRAFNVHAKKEYPLACDLSKFSHVIYVENVYSDLEPDVNNYAGICLDISHLENDRILEPVRYAMFVKSLESHKIGANHISASIKTDRISSDGFSRRDRHHFEELSEFDYLKRYPKKYFSDICALELENTLADQLRARDYIINLLK